MRVLSWKNIEETTDKLAKKIQKEFQPDYLVGITTGGLIPLFFLAKKLNVNNIFTISVKSKKVLSELLPEIDLKSKNILLIDEITESGESLKKVYDFLQKRYSPKEIKTATLAVNKDKCKFLPDYYILTQQAEWIVFPWEKGEKWVSEDLKYS